MTKFKNTSAGDLMIAIDAGKRATNGEPFVWWKVMHPNEVFDIKNEAIKGASVNPNLRLVSDDTPTTPIKTGKDTSTLLAEKKAKEKEALKILKDDYPAKDEVETQIKTGELPKRRGRPPKQ